MAVSVRIPTPLRTFTGGEDTVNVEAATVAEALDALEAKAPGIKDRVCDAKGIRRSVNIFLGEEDVRYLDGLGTAVKAGDEISIVPAIAGGARA